MTGFDERTYPAQTILRLQSYAYSQDSAGNPYISSVTTTMEPGQGTQIQKKTTQTLDSFGNATQTQIYDWGNLATPIRTYTNTYVTNSNYTSRYIHNRLLTSTVTDGTHNVTLASITYDGSSIINVPSMYEHDSAYNSGFTYRGNPTTKTTPAGTTTIAYDIGGNVTSAAENGHTVTIGTDSGTNYAAPASITTNVTTNYTWSTFPRPEQRRLPTRSCSIRHSKHVTRPR